MRIVTVRDARAQLRALLDRVTVGEEIIILRRWKEVARLAGAADQKATAAARPDHLPRVDSAEAKAD